MREQDSRQGMVTVGLDVGDRHTRVCSVAVREGGVVVLEERRVLTEAEALGKYVGRWGRARAVLETGTHSPWIDELLRSKGHEVLVLHARRLALVYGATVKDDRRDARLLADLGAQPPLWLPVIRHRSRETREQLLVLKSHEQMSRARVKLVNAVRGQTKPFGVRVRKCATKNFPFHAEAVLPASMRATVMPLLGAIDDLSARVAAYEKQFKEVIDGRYPETRRMMQVSGVGPETALCFRLLVEDPGRFPDARDVGAYFGLTPKRDQSGDRDLQLGISKAGDGMMRRLLVSAAAYVLGPFGPDCDLRRWGLRRMERGGGIARKKARVGVARRLAVLMLRLWVTGEKYEPLRHEAVAAEA